MFNITELESDFQIYHSNFQIDNFITLGEKYNMWGCYKQSLRELMKRIGVYRESFCNDKILNIKIRQVQSLIDVETDEFEIELLKIELLRKQLKVTESEKNLKEIERELTQFWKHSQILKTRLEKIHGKLNEEIRDELEIGYWKDKYKNQLAIDMATQKHPSESQNLLSKFNIDVQLEVMKECPPEEAIKQQQQKIPITFTNEELNNITLDFESLNLLN